MYVYIYIHIYVYIYVCVYIDGYTYTNIYIHIYYVYIYTSMYMLMLPTPFPHPLSSATLLFSPHLLHSMPALIASPQFLLLHLSFFLPSSETPINHLRPKRLVQTAAHLLMLVDPGGGPFGGLKSLRCLWAGLHPRDDQLHPNFQGT